MLFYNLINKQISNLNNLFIIPLLRFFIFFKSLLKIISYNLVFILCLSSCAPEISNFNSYVSGTLVESDFMPNIDMVEGIAPKIVVFELDEAENQVAKQAGIGKSMAINVENTLGESNLVQIVDRNIASKLREEIALAEMKKDTFYKGPEVADYAISGAISDASFTKKYSSGFVIANNDGGIVKIPPKFTYQANIKGSLKIYELPQMNVAANFDFNGKKVRSENVKSNSNIDIAGIVEFGSKKSEGINRDDGLVRQAGVEAIEEIAIDLKNFFAKKGFILEKRVFKDKSIFKINLGSDDKINPGDKFVIIGKYETINPITNKSEIEKRIIANGKVSHKIDPQSSWVLIDDKNSVNLIRLGDIVKFKYERGFFGKMDRLVNKISGY